jgi:hypothetical protein
LQPVYITCLHPHNAHFNPEDESRCSETLVSAYNIIRFVSWIILKYCHTSDKTALNGRMIDELEKIWKGIIIA